jgi:hypothetical protein
VNDHSLNGGGEDDSYFLDYVSPVARLDPKDRFTHAYLASSLVNGPS